MQTDPRASKLSATDRLELERGMTRILLQELEVLVRQYTHLDGQRLMAAPEPCRRGVVHGLRWEPASKSACASASKASSLPVERSSAIW